MNFFVSNNKIFKLWSRTISSLLLFFLILNFSANLTLITTSLFDTYIVNVENIDVTMTDLVLQNSGISAEENQEEENGRSSSEEKSPSEIDWFVTNTSINNYFLHLQMLNSNSRFIICNGFLNTPYRPPQA
jgi:hypothetical protein